MTKSSYSCCIGLSLPCKIKPLFVGCWHEHLEPFWLVKYVHEFDLGLMHVKEPKTPYDFMFMWGQTSYDIMHVWGQTPYDTVHVCGQSLYDIVHVLRPICNMLVMWTPLPQFSPCLTCDSSLPSCTHLCHIIPNMLIRFHVRWGHALGSLGKLENGPWTWHGITWNM